MHITSIAILLCLMNCAEVIYAKTCTATCPNGGKIYTWGTQPVEHKVIVAMHNKFRQVVLNGKLSGQPKAKSMEMMQYDKNLARLAKNVTRTCRMNHVSVKDKRWFAVGQNLFIERSSRKESSPNWEKAITKWFDENKLYTYPNEPTKLTGHYTQVVAEKSTHVGCDYIFFYDHSRPTMPYTKLYACNYGPAGNIRGVPPYPRG